MIRPPRTDEVEVLAMLWHDAWHDGHAPFLPATLVAQRTPATFSERLPKLLARLLVAGGSQPHGLVAWTEKGELGQLFVRRGARGRGLGGVLLAAGERALASAGHDGAFLFCGFRNPARSFYLRHGWHDPGLTVRMLALPAGDSLSVLVHRMTKTLT